MTHRTTLGSPLLIEGGKRIKNRRLTSSWGGGAIDSWKGDKNHNKIPCPSY